MYANPVPGMELYHNVVLLCWGNLFRQLPRSVDLTVIPPPVSLAAVFNTPLIVPADSLGVCTLLHANIFRLISALFAGGHLPSSAINRAVFSCLKLGVQHASCDVREAALCALHTVVRAYGLPGEFMAIELATVLIKCLVDYQDAAVLTSSEFDEQVFPHV